MGAGRLRIICGPTAAGKSQVAIDLAEMFGGAIVSADSRQVYKGFDIGTAKPRAGERARVPHYGLDVIEPASRYSAARWAADAAGWIARARNARLIPVVVGGTGLYIKALVEPLFSAPDFEPASRVALARELESRPLADLRRWCRELDPARAHLGRTQILRAIETALLSGRRISELHAAHSDAPGAAQYDASYLVVDPGPTLAGRIEARVDAMLESGWRGEAESLSRTVPAEAPAWNASGYSVMRSLAAGEIDLSTARERVIIETRQYAKRQRTWFRHQLPADDVTRVNPDDPAAIEVVRDWWERAE
ncbi:MAG: tRNA (adenosine(37)-N6)-dimethylallyltransferase MiaA [Gemmatimonadota bacterium]|nr:tRNA (adenosine(37)-N6)-dimethylallyltransferase MiaA [Gemmatimonadota bacterium]